MGRDGRAGRVRRWGTAVVMAGVATLAAPAAAAAFDVVPLGCGAQAQAFDSQGHSVEWGVYGYDNPNPATTTVAYGPDNLMLQPPNFRTGQPTSFSPGRHDAVYLTLFDNDQTPELDWILQGAEASTSSVCGGAAGPQPDSPPALGGGASTAAVGDTLSIDPGTFSGPDGAVIAIVERCAQAECVPASDQHTGSATPTSYTVTSADAGDQLRLRSYRMTTYGWASALSQAVSVDGTSSGPPAPPVEAINPVDPIPLTEPAVAGSPGVGLTLTADTGQWTGPTDPSLSVRWQRCDSGGCTDIAGADTSQYTPAAADAGDRLRAVVTAAEAVPTFGPSGQVAETAASAATAAVTAAPAVLAPPAIAGSADPGTQVTLTDPGRYGEPVTTAVQWQSCDGQSCADIPGATGTTYTVSAADAGHTLRAAVTATSPHGRTVVDSAPLGPAGAVRVLAAPQVAGFPTTGAILWTDGGAFTGTPDPGLSFQWLRCDASGDGCAAIAGASHPAYAPTDADAGHTLKVAVTAANPFSAATATSAPSQAVKDPVALVPSPAAPLGPPLLSRISAAPARFRPGRDTTSVRFLRGRPPRGGTTVSMSIDQPSFLRVDVQRRSRRHFATLLTATRAVSAGVIRMRFSGRLPGHGPLAPGQIRLRLTAINAIGRTGRVHTLALTVLR